jgi:integrase
MTKLCLLADGRRVKFGLKRRDRDPYWLVRFRGPGRKALERSTKEQNKNRAADAACVIIREVYEPAPEDTPSVTWQQAKDALRRHLEASGLRAATVKRYLSNLNVLAEMFPETRGPSDIRRGHGADFKLRRSAQVDPETLHSNINQLRFTWRKWLGKECKLVTANPWAEVELPKLDKKKPRVVTDAQKRAFVGWLQDNFPGWRLPCLFIETKAYLGCRISELAALVPAQLQAGRVCFVSDVSKGRKSRECKVPPELFEELRAGAGPQYVFERFSEELRALYHARGLKHVAAKMKPFKPRYLSKWMQERLIDFRNLHADVPYFKLHGLRATAISEVRQTVSAEKAAVFFGVSPRVMAQHYEALDEVAIADEVAEVRQRKVGRKGGDAGGGPPHMS